MEQKNIRPRGGAGCLNIYSEKLLTGAPEELSHLIE